MSKQSRRVTNNAKAVSRSTVYSLDEAIGLIKTTANTKFAGSAELHVRTNIDPKKTDQQIRGSVSLPHGTGKTLKIAAFVTEAKADEARKAGAAIIGNDDVIKDIKENGKTDFDIAIAETAMMPKLASIAKILGTRGLMPNPKTGTVGDKIEDMIKAISGGKINFKNDNTGNIHAIFGKTSFTNDQLAENLTVLIEAIMSSKPVAVKKNYVASASVNSTMGPGIRIKM